jgi:hypothetical protein
VSERQYGFGDVFFAVAAESVSAAFVYASCFFRYVPESDNVRAGDYGGFLIPGDIPANGAPYLYMSLGCAGSADSYFLIPVFAFYFLLAGGKRECRHYRRDDDCYFEQFTCLHTIPLDWS